jgi:hypothetical protein
MTPDEKTELRRYIGWLARCHDRGIGLTDSGTREMFRAVLSLLDECERLEKERDARPEISPEDARIWTSPVDLLPFKDGTERDATLVMHRRVDWGEDDGNVLWWTWPVTEPPYCGTELDDDFPEYVTHWTRLPDQQALEAAHVACESLVMERMLR